MQAPLLWVWRSLLGCVTMQAVLGDKPQQDAHDKNDQIETVGRRQRGMGSAVSDDGAGDDEGQHGADGAAGQDKVHQLRRGDLGLLRSQRNQRGIDSAADKARPRIYMLSMALCWLLTNMYIIKVERAANTVTMRCRSKKRSATLKNHMPTI